MDARNNVAAYRWIAAMAIGALVAGAASWFAYGAEAVSEDELATVVGRLETRLDAVQVGLNALSVDLAEFRGEFRASQSHSFGEP